MKKINTIILVASVVFLAVILSIVLVNKYIYKNQVTKLLTQVNQASLFVKAEDILSFSKNNEDLNKENYQNILKNLVSFRKMNPEIRFLYILGYDKNIGKQYFILDTESPSSLDYSPPGQVFEDTRDSDIANFLKGESYTDGSYEDSWGKWYSAYSPIKDNEGNMVALLGIDVSVAVWRSEVIFSSVIISLLGILIGVIILFLIFSIYNKDFSIQHLEKETGFLSLKEKKFQEFKEKVKAGQFIFYVSENLLSFDDYLYSNFNLKENNKLALEDFLNLVYTDDQKVILDLINKIKSKEINSFTTNIRMLNSQGIYLLYNITAETNSASLQTVTLNGIIKLSDIL